MSSVVIKAENLTKQFVLRHWGFHVHLDTHSTNTWTVIPR
ncbi:hypothetical protein BV352_05692 [Pseudomonas syringae pv. actinidiae]|nr:hypothetical protein BV352_05692 [Pseudomonas syringae pv. actinidiae]